jgi:cellulose synthase/poly-beta-1,6-N-acetylglucosamine synthase-like glycosyltransferase
MYSTAELSYVFCTSLLIPFGVYVFVVPVGMLHNVYWMITGFFMASAVWVFLESASSFVSVQWKAKRNQWSRTTEEVQNPAKSVLLLIPAYLDNERVVLKDTLEAYTKISYAGPIKVMLIYNVRDRTKTREFEEYLMENWHNKVVNNIIFEVYENLRSKSKSENVNYALNMEGVALFDFIGIYDADHHPEPNSITTAIKVFDTFDCGIVQGQCAIRNYDETFLAHVIAMEYVDMYNLGHEGRSFIFNLGLFGGSNGIWKSGLLLDVKMDGEMLTEDIDSSFRATLKGANIQYCADMISYELCPVQWDTLLKQRKRWSQGWFEVSIRHTIPTLISRHTSFRQKIGCFLILIWRELFVYFIFHPICIVLAYAYKTHLIEPILSQWAILLVIGLKGILKTCLVYPMANPRLQQQSVWWFMVYVIFYPVYSTVMNITHISTHYRHFSANKTWVATTRDSSTGSGQKVSNTTADSNADSPSSSQIELIVQV